jgi:hypothetical protein
MIDPDDIIPTGENSENDPEDQESQKDVHSDGLEGTDDEELYEEPDVEGLQAADKASEAAFTLDVERDKKPEPKK